MANLPDELNEYWQRVDSEAAQLKDSHYALEKLIARFESLDHDERSEAERVVADWTLSDDPRKRFDAISLVNHFRIRFALPMLRELAERFEHSDEASAPYEWAWVNRVIGRIASEQSGRGSS